MSIRNPLIPDLIVTALTSSLDLWVTQLGFDIVQDPDGYLLRQLGERPVRSHS
ncbi:hypothetical protein RGV33_05170 [Pseudomonas sp. Bout1]|uniref:hypothetical protein n=1 Tax=Pseudomonas sp. Bout1 TaxID=3048600 RepID=UPI002AB33327|nr:hypothetical protein [Pseudomonas sp. Bout1]MDY7531070.1 hypothetical protein [Pseudomonas sp. Bout1]MEB0183724.1 hypothetical protein [Pseudomonas sp. Bout1]